MAATPALIALPSLGSTLRNEGTLWGDIVLSLTFVFIGLVANIYIFSRVYLVVESFISLRHLPIGVFAAVPWVQVILHI